jgi:hypothetical protein
MILFCFVLFDRAQVFPRNTHAHARDPVRTRCDARACAPPRIGFACTARYGPHPHGARLRVHSRNWQHALLLPQGLFLFLSLSSPLSFSFLYTPFCRKSAYSFVTGRGTHANLLLLRSRLRVPATTGHAQLGHEVRLVGL